MLTLFVFSLGKEGVYVCGGVVNVRILAKATVIAENTLFENTVTAVCSTVIHNSESW